MCAISAACFRVRFLSCFATSISGSLGSSQRYSTFLLGFTGRSSNISITAGRALTGLGIPDIMKGYCPIIVTISSTFLEESNSTNAVCGRLGPR
uniref:Secreted protein n=1 Tax=Lotus japonicus TaxID=34305 RepID=I3TAA1_LOTJA|nr:unknown [Lotus japonicus]